jgi:hypothetical protein
VGKAALVVVLLLLLKAGDGNERVFGMGIADDAAY